jgi:hypothetical protein
LGKSYLKGLDFQIKNRYFPQIAVKNPRINTMVAPGNFKEGCVPNLLGKEKRNDRKLYQSFVEAEVPHAGAWFYRNKIPTNNIEKL